MVSYKFTLTIFLSCLNEKNHIVIFYVFGNLFLFFAATAGKQRQHDSITKQGCKYPAA